MMLFRDMRLCYCVFNKNETALLYFPRLDVVLLYSSKTCHSIGVFSQVCSVVGKAPLGLRFRGVPDLLQSVVRLQGVV